MGELAGKEASAGKRVLIFIEDGDFASDNRVKREVKTLESAGFVVRVICPRFGGTPWRETIGQTRVYRYPKPVFGDGFLSHVCEYVCSLGFGFLLSLWVAVRRGFDVIQLCNPPDFLFPIAVFFKVFGKRYIFDQHDACPELFESRFGAGRKSVQAVLRWSERMSWRWADGILSANDSYRQAAISRGGVAADRIVTVRNGPDLERFSEWSEPQPQERVCVGYVGNMNPQDGIDNLLRAAHHLRHELDRTDIHFVLIGDGDALPDLQALAAELKLEDGVRFTGRLIGDALCRELDRSDIGCQPDPPSPFNSISTMVKALEYMALAKPVVAFDLAETRVSCGDAALYADEGNPRALASGIVRLADDFELRRSMGLLGRQRVEQALAWKYSEKPYLSMYYDVLGISMPEEVRERLAEVGSTPEPVAMAAR